MNQEQDKRLIVSFSGKCALNCPYCYAPFNGIKPVEETLRDILDFAKKEHISILTFGGGDPFQHREFRSTLVKAKESNFFVHVDTHGIGLKSNDYPLILSNVDLMGLPLEGPRESHDTMRKRVGHFDSVMTLLKNLKLQNTKVKVNTLVSRPNIGSLESLEEIIQVAQPAIWSLYQFMDLPGEPATNEAYAISTTDFLDLAFRIRDRNPNIKVEVGEPSRRTSGYLFTQTDGTLFTHNTEQGGYLVLGSIYDSEWKTRFERLNSTMLPELSVQRYPQTSRGKESPL